MSPAKIEAEFKTKWRNSRREGISSSIKAMFNFSSIPFTHDKPTVLLRVGCMDKNEWMKGFLCEWYEWESEEWAIVVE